jgi:glycerol-3-phosphate acyltransferase PlsY
MEWLAFVATAIAGYLIGSIPTGFLVGKAKGIDIRSLGSGNIGATNVMRFLGKPLGILVLLMDTLKGWAGCGVLAHLVYLVFGAAPGREAQTREWLAILGGVSAILGHNYTCWLHFKGGKGIATSAGVLIALMPGALLICLAVWGVIFGLTRYVSLASIATAFSLPFAVWITRGTTVLIGVGTFLALMALYKHRTNMQRLLKGTEHRFGAPKPDESRPINT